LAIAEKRLIVDHADLTGLLDAIRSALMKRSPPDLPQIFERERRLPRAV